MIQEQTQAAVPHESQQCPNTNCARPVEGARCSHCGVALSAGGWKVERVLAQSAHSRVYVARDGNGQVVALKELHFALVPSMQELDAFEREAKTLESLQLEGTPRFVQQFTEGTGVGLRLYLATEFVRGESLADRLARGPLPEADVLAVARALLGVLISLQQRSPAIFHRDLKPANVMFREDGRVVLVDFGSARTVDGSRTHRSTLVGTFGYMPPEQLGGTVDRTSDVFALGATVLHAVTGRPPSDLFSSAFTLDIPTSVSPSLRAWLQTALAFERSRRFQDAGAALAALDAPFQTRRSRYRRLVGLSVLTGILGGVLLFGLMLPTLQVDVPPLVIEDNWFTRVKSGCNQLEVNGVMARTPPPPGMDGAGYGAGCYALAGRHADARKLIEALPAAQRATAAWHVFEIAHPVADQGDDAAAGPMMELVLEFWPENFQAIYHAGIAEYAQGDTVRAKERLDQFLSLYKQPDNFTNTAKLVLARIEKGLPADPSMGLGRH